MPQSNINGELASHGHMTGQLTILQAGTSDYEELENKPQINGHELIDNQTAHELGLASMQDVSDIESDIALLYQKLPKNYTTEEQNTGVKWIDGKYIYQKTYYVENPTPQSVSTFKFYLITQDNSGCDKLINWHGFFVENTGRCYLFPYNRLYSASDEVIEEIYCENGILTVAFTTRNAMNITVTYAAITVFYTKSE